MQEVSLDDHQTELHSTHPPPLPQLWSPRPRPVSASSPASTGTFGAVAQPTHQGEAVFGSGPHDTTLGWGPVSKKDSKIKVVLFGLLVKWLYVVICVYMCVCECECVCLRFSDND